MDEDHGKGLIDLPNDQIDHISFDYLINELIDRVEDHRERAARQRSRAGNDGFEDFGAFINDQQIVDAP